MRPFSAFVGLLSYALFALFIGWLYQPGPEDLVLDLHPCDAPPGEPVTPFYRLLQEAETVRLCGRLPADRELLVLSRLAGNALKVEIDGRVVYRNGTLDRPANFWLQPQRIPLEETTKGARALEIELGGLYDLGVRTHPYLSRAASESWRSSLLSWIHGDLVLLAAGFNLGMGLLLLIYGVIRKRERVDFSVLGISSLCAAIYLLDFHPSGSAASVGGYLLRRKVSIAAAYWSLACLAVALERMTGLRRRLGAWFCVGAGFLTLLVFAQSQLPALKEASTWASFVTIPTILYLVAVAVRRLEPVYAALWTFLGAAALHVALNVGPLRGHLYLVQFGVVAGMLAGGFRSAIQLTRVATDLERASQAAMTDPLTGALNRAFTRQLTLSATDVVALVDFDGFKEVNDRFGHLRGDRLLVEFVTAARSRLRVHDHVVRIGGDEFLIVLRQVAPEQARGILEEVIAAWRSTSPDLQPTASVGLVQVGSSSLEQAIARADERMYAAKADRKASLES